MGQNRPANRKKRRAKQTEAKHVSEDTGPPTDTGPHLPRWLDLDSAIAARKAAVQRKCQAQAQAPKDLQELYGSFLPSHGLLCSRVCSRVCSGKGEILFVHPSYDDHASLYSPCRPPFAPSTPSTSPATPCATESSSSSLEERSATPSLVEVAKQPGPTPLQREQAQSFADKCRRGLVHLCLAVGPRDNASEDPQNRLALPPYVEELRTDFPPAVKVQIVSGAGNRFTGVLPVDGDACIVFDPTCSDAVISDSMATGMVVCYGRGCHVTFSNCHFDLDTKIVALAGASVQLTGCTFTRNSVNVVYAHACGTCVTVESCFFTGGGHPVSVAGGATVTVTGSTFSRPLVNAMVVSDKGSLLKVEKCRVQGAESAVRPAQNSTSGTQSTTGPTLAPPRGVLVCMGARLELSNTDITNVGRGVTVFQSSAAVLTSCSVTCMSHIITTGTTACCIQSYDSNVELLRCVLDTEKGNSVELVGVTARRSSVKLRECRVLRNKWGVALHRCQAVLADCEFERSEEASVLAGDRSVLEMRTCVCNGKAQRGVQVADSDCRLQGVTVVGCETGFFLDSIRSNAVLADCKAVDVLRLGARVEGAGARVRVQGLEMRLSARQEASGIFVSKAGRADIDNCKLPAGSHVGAVLASGKCSEVRGEDCKLSGCMGACAMRSAKVTLWRCATRECTRGYQVETGAELKLHNCTSTGDDIGFSCMRQGHLHAQDCELRGFSCGAAVTSTNGVGGGTCKLDRCRFVDSERYPAERDWCPSGVGVYLGGKGADVSMHGCTVSGMSGDCVWVSDQAKATLEGCQLSHSNASGVACVDQGSEVTLDGCNVSKNGGNGVHCQEGGCVVARRVHSCGNTDNGFAALGNGSMTLKDCSSDRDHAGCLAFGEMPEVQGTARVALSGVLVRRSSAAGFVFDSHAKGCMKHCAALQCGLGMQVVPSPCVRPQRSPRGTAPGLSVFDSTFARCGGGVVVQGGFTVSMQNVLCSRIEGCAVGCLGAGSRLALTRCEVAGSGEPYHCAEGGKLHCIECQPSGPCMED